RRSKVDYFTNLGAFTRLGEAPAMRQQDDSSRVLSLSPRKQLKQNGQRSKIEIQHGGAQGRLRTARIKIGSNRDFQDPFRSRPNPIPHILAKIRVVVTAVLVQGAIDALT